MKPAMLFFAVFALCLMAHTTSNTAYAHGGAYRGPAGEVPPGQRDPKDPQPPPAGGTTPTPGPNDGKETPPPKPPTGGGDGGTTDKPPPPPPVGDSPDAPKIGGGTTTRERKRARRPDTSFDSWLFWWAYNKDEILNVKARLKAAERRAATSSPIVHLGMGKGGTPAKSPTARMIREQVVPALLQLVANREIHPDIRGGALIALARAEPTRKHVTRFFKIARAESDEDQLVKESAIIALGILALDDEEIRDFLVGIVEDRNYAMRGRCFAMVSLGLIGGDDEDSRVYRALRGRLTGREVHVDIPVFALMSIGLLGDERNVPELLGWLESGRIGTERISDLERSWIVAALGRIGHPSALKAITRQLRMKHRYTKRSAAIAIGQIAPMTDATEQLRLAKTLVQFHRDAGDLTAKNFAVIALGRIAGAKAATEKVTEAVTGFLKKAFVRANRTTERPYVALAMGLTGLDSDHGNVRALREELAGVIRPVLREGKGDKVAQGALAIALGMLEDRGSVELLTRILGDRGTERKLRGAAAVALGLIGDRGASDAILRTLREREDRRLRVETAVAAGLLGNPAAVDELLKVFTDRKASQYVLGSVALALGQIGDRRAIEPMLMVLEPEKTNGSYPDLTRALVAVALGQVGDRRDLRILYRLSKDINYRASVPSLDEILSIL